jgi:hypothetical protein
MKEEIAHEKKIRNLRLLALGCCGAAIFSILQARYSQIKFVWEVFWLFYLGGMELLLEPFTRKQKGWMRFLIFLMVAVVVAGMVFGTYQIGKIFNLPNIYLFAIPWLLIGVIFYLWSLWVTFQDW